MDETQKLIDELRAKRAALGNTVNTSKRLHYKRVSRPRAARMVIYFYTFIGGMLFSATLQGSLAAGISFSIVIIVLVITHLRE